MMELLTEARDLNIYKIILDMFANFIDSNPGTGMNKIYRKLADAGLKSVPKDKRARLILDSMISMSIPKTIQDLLNTSFVDLPINTRPIYKSVNSRLTAFWTRGGKLYDKVFDLFDIDGSGDGKWTDEKGDSIILITNIE